MKAVICTQLEGFEKLTIGDLPCPEFTKTDVLIRVQASAMNFADSLIVKGRYQVKPPLPFSPGMECAGIIEAVGDEVTHLQKGDRVMAILDGGGFAQYAVAHNNDVFKIPDTMDFKIAATLPIAYGTSHHALSFKANLQRNEFLVVHGASGGVGLTALEIGKKIGATVIATASSDNKLEICKQYGADYTLNSTLPNLREKIKELTDGQGAHVVYDPVGGDIFTESVRSTRQDGRIVIIGFASGNVSEIPANIIMVKNISCIGYHFGAYRTLNPESLKQCFKDIVTWVQEGSLRPHISYTFSMDDIKKAYECMLERRSTGKIVIEINH